MPPRVRAAIGGAALARASAFCVGPPIAARSARRAGLGGGRTLRDAALVGGQMRWHDAGW
eukprot:7079442-Prymnesium_polylepis.1